MKTTGILVAVIIQIIAFIIIKWLEDNYYEDDKNKLFQSVGDVDIALRSWSDESKIVVHRSQWP